MSLYEAITHLRGVLEQDVFLPADAEELAKRRENLVSDDDVDRLSDDILDVARDEANDIYRSLEKQYDYLMSDEGIIEELKNNDREFDVDPETGRLDEAKDVFKPASKKEVAKRMDDAKAARIKSGKVYFDDLNDKDMDN